MVAILVWRPPLAVARSLRRRDGSPIPYGVALWERYNRSAIANLAGTDVYVLSYDDMVEDPGVSLRGLTSWLDSTGHFDGMQPSDQAAPCRQSPRAFATSQCGRREATLAHRAGRTALSWLITSPSCRPS